MQMLLKHKLLIAGVTLAAAASAGGAYAATQSSTSPQQAYLKDVAKRLNVSPAKLRAALKAALIDRLNAMVKAGQLTQAQATRIEQRIDKRGEFPRFLGGPGPRAPFFGGPGPRGFRPPGFVRGPLHVAASYLGLTDAQLMKGVFSGQSLAQLAKKQGKSVSGLEQALANAAKAELGRAVSAGLITKAQEQKLESRLSAHIDRLVNRTGFPHIHRHGPWAGPPPGAAFGAAPAFAPPPPGA